MEKKQRVTVEQLTKMRKDLLDGRIELSVDEVYNLIMDLSSDWDDRILGDTPEDAHYIGTISVQVCSKLDDIITFFLTPEKIRELFDRLEKLVPTEPGMYTPHIINCMIETLYYRLPCSVCQAETNGSTRVLKKTRII